MAPKIAPPPHIHHKALNTTLSPAEAKAYLEDFVSLTSKKAHLHPDSVLSTTGVQFPPTSGPGGGLALHHLRRIAEGLGGTNLVPETWEELAKFSADGGLNGEEEPEHARPEDSSQRQHGKRRRRDEIEQWAETSAPATPGATSEVESFAVDDREWLSQEQFESEQREWEGEIGNRDGARVVRQGGEPPAMDAKAARKAEKAARKLEERRKKAKLNG